MPAVSRFRSLVYVLVSGGLVWLASAGLVAQVLPDLPGNTPPVRLAAPRIPPLPEAEWTDEHRALVARYGPEVRIGNAFRTLLHVPAAGGGGDAAVHPRHERRLHALAQAPRAADPAHRLVVPERLRVGRTRAGRQDRRRLTGADLRRIAQGPDAAGWDPFEATLLRLADELFRNSSVGDATWNALAADYDLYELVDATLTVNDLMLLSTLFNSMGVQPEQQRGSALPGRCPLPDRSPRTGAAPRRAAGRPARGLGPAGRSHVRPTPATGPGAEPQLRLRQPRLAPDSPLSGATHPPDRLELPGGVRVGQACGERRTRP